MGHGDSSRLQTPHPQEAGRRWQDSPSGTGINGCYRSFHSLASRGWKECVGSKLKVIHSANSCYLPRAGVGNMVESKMSKEALIQLADELTAAKGI